MFLLKIGLPTDRYIPLKLLIEKRLQCMWPWSLQNYTTVHCLFRRNQKQLAEEAWISLGFPRGQVVGREAYLKELR